MKPRPGRKAEKKWGSVVLQAMQVAGVPRGRIRASKNVLALVHRDDDDLKDNDSARGTDSELSDRGSDGTASDMGSEGPTPMLTPKSAASAERDALLSLLGVSEASISARIDAEKGKRRQIATNSLSVASATLSNTQTDSFASVRFSNSKFSATALVFAFYRE